MRKIKSKRQKPQTFPWRMKKWWQISWNWCVWARCVEEEQSLDARERNENPFWNQYRKRIFLCNTRVFRDCIKSRASCQGQLLKHLKENFWKKFLSVFQDWKFHLRESRELSRENLYLPLTTGPSTREQVANLSREKHEIPKFWKIF